MKKIVILFVLFFTTLLTNAQIGIQTNSPDASAALDIVATDKGLLIPRVTLTNDLTNASPVSSPATGLLVFNISAANQPIGLYFWDGSSWNLFNAGAIATGYWNLTGNSGTTVGTNFIGTTDAEDFAVYTDDTERMRFTSDGQGLVGLTTPANAGDLFSVEANATQTWAINGYGVDCGVYGIGGSYGLYGAGGTFGMRSVVDGSSSYSSYSTNADPDGWSAMFAGSGFNGSYLTGHSAGVSGVGNDGIFAAGKASDGFGIIAGGNNVGTFSTVPTGGGGSFSGYHGVYGSASNANGIGVIGVGNDKGTYHTMTDGSGGAFSGYHGAYAYADTANGTGVLGVGNQYSGGIYLSSNGSGGAFTGYDGSISTAINGSGTGVIGVGNGGSYYLYTGGSGNGSGGAFTGEYCGVAGYGLDNDDNTVGVYGFFEGGTTRNDGIGVYGVAQARNGYGYGVVGQGNRYGVYANGNLGASGTKSFAIDHPDDPENKILKHYAIESNEVLNMYRGNIVLDQNGDATITLPNYFMTINIDFSYVLTPIGQRAPDLYVSDEINNQGEFSISGGKAGQKISWIVYADRNDPYMQKNKEHQVDVIEKREHEKGKYLMPELYNQPPEKGIFYTKKPTPNKAHIESSNKYEEIKVKSEELIEVDKRQPK